MHMKFTTIHCSRAFSSPLKRTKRVSPVSSNRVIIDILEPHPCFPKIDSSVLTQIVKQKNVDQLVEYGGVEGLSSGLRTSLEVGINGDDEDISQRNEAFGTNTFRRPLQKNLFHFVWEALRDPTILIILVLAALSLGFGIKDNGLREGWYNGGSIFVVVFLAIAISAIRNFRQNRQFLKLSKISNNILVDAVRNGRRQRVSIFKIVVGDVVFLKIGDQVPADGLFIDGHSLLLDESSMTGESDHVEVNPIQNPFLFSGTKVADGFGRMLVTGVGMNTTWGEMMSTISNDTFAEQTPLQSRLNKLTSSIGKVGLAFAFLVLVMLLGRYFSGTTKDEYGNTEFNGSRTRTDDVINDMVGIIAAAVNIVDVAIPEGLPLAVTPLQQIAALATTFTNVT